MIRKRRYIRPASFVLVIATVALTAAMSGAIQRADASSPRVFPMGWWSSTQEPQRLPGMRAAGMSAVLPYTRNTVAGVSLYLNEAQKQGMRVWAQVDPLLLIKPNATLIGKFAASFRNHPALYGWMLVDEPTVHEQYKNLTPGLATQIYREIKRVDPKHPVGIAFGSGENPKPWIHAMDILMYDDYAQCPGKPEFWGLDAWRGRIARAASTASHIHGFMPILQAFGQDKNGNYQIQKRLPTTNEMRYLAFTSLQYRATGMWFWVSYRSREDWISRTLTPLTKEIAPALRAMGAGPASGVSSGSGSMRSTLFRDPVNHALYLIVVHHGSGNARLTVNVASALHVAKAAAKGRPTRAIAGGKLVDDFGPYGARLYKLSA